MDEQRYVDSRSGRSYPLDVARWRGDDGAPLMVSAMPGITREQVLPDVRSLWRYRAALPGVIGAAVSMGEGCTPLVEQRWGSSEVRFKLEWFSPTGSFKDRGTSVMMSYLAGQGITEVIEDSSGNGGSSVSAYAARAGIRARILAPEGTSPAKVLQSQAYGAEVELVPGDREATSARALAESARTYYASHNWHPFFLQGTKTLAYELWEDLGFRAPDAVVTVAGAGSIVLGLDLGFSELLAAGQISQLPRLLVAQPEACAPIVGAFAGRPVSFAPTIAEGTAIQKPIRLPEVLAAIRRSGGDMAAIPEPDIVDAVRRLAAVGLYAEPTSATAAAAIDVFRSRGLIRDDETTVVVLTGSGLKATTRMTEVFDAVAD